MTWKLERREALHRLAKAAGNGLITTAMAADVLGRDRQTAAVILSRMVKAGWIARVRRGAYVVPSLDTVPGHATADDPWIIAATLFAPCYIGGWTAAEHWEFTEQIFRETFVVSAAHVRRRTIHAAGAAFRVVRVQRAAVENVGTVWRGPVRIAVSDRERTLTDALNHPGWLGGTRQILGALRAYRDSRSWNEAKLLENVMAFGSGAAAKRLGYLANEFLDVSAQFLSALSAAKSTGLAKLDPALPPRGRIDSRWNVRVNVQLGEEA